MSHLNLSRNVRLSVLLNLDFNTSKLIAQQLIENKYARTWEESPSKQPRCSITEHHLISLPPGKNLNKGDWQLARASTKPGNAPASLPM